MSYIIWQRYKCSNKYIIKNNNRINQIYLKNLLLWIAIVLNVGIYHKCKKLQENTNFIVAVSRNKWTYKFR